MLKKQTDGQQTMLGAEFADFGEFSEVSSKEEVIEFVDESAKVPPGEEGVDGKTEAEIAAAVEAEKQKVLSQNDKATIEIDEKELSVEETEKKKLEDKDLNIEVEASDKERFSPTGSSTDLNSQETILKALAQDLVQGGLFPQFTDEDWTTWVEEKGVEGAMFELRKLDRENLKEEFRTALDPDELARFDVSETGADMDQFTNLQKQLKYLDGLDMEEFKTNSELAKSVITSHFKMTSKLSDAKIKGMLDNYEDTDVLADEATTGLDEMKNLVKEQQNFVIEQAKQEKIKVDDDQKRVKEDLKKDIKALKEIVPGLELNDIMKDNLFKSMTVPVKKDKKGLYYTDVMVKQSINPKAFNMAVHFYNMMGLFDFDKDGNFTPDFTKVINNLNTKVVKSNLSKLMDTGEGFEGGKDTGKNKMAVAKSGSMLSKQFD